MVTRRLCAEFPDSDDAVCGTGCRAMPKRIWRNIGGFSLSTWRERDSRVAEMVESLDEP